LTTTAIGRYGRCSRLDGQLVLSPTDLTHHQECAQLTRLDLGVATGEWAAPTEVASPELDLIFERGLDHEKRYPDSLKAEGKTVVEIQTVFDADGRRRAEAQTVEAMRRGVDVVYLGTFFDGARGGQADFLLRVDTPSPAFGDWSYEIADTKLARKLKVAALLQMATYAERFTVFPGVAPEFIHVVAGDGVSRPWRLIDVAAYARRARARLEAFVAGSPATGPSPIGYFSSAAGPRSAPPSCGRPTTSAWWPACAATSGTRCGRSVSRPCATWRRRPRSC
jgi:predicted RecB family nuclease